MFVGVLVAYAGGVGADPADLVHASEDRVALDGAPGVAKGFGVGRVEDGENFDAVFLGLRGAEGDGHAHDVREGVEHRDEYAYGGLGVAFGVYDGDHSSCDAQQVAEGSRLFDERGLEAEEQLQQLCPAPREQHHETHRRVCSPRASCLKKTQALTLRAFA